MSTSKLVSKVLISLLLLFAGFPVMGQSWGGRDLIEEDISNIKNLAEQGDSDAQFNLGVRYANSLGVERNDVVAVKWYTLASEQGHAGALNNLGFMYVKNRGVEENFEKAAKLFKLSADQCDPYGLSNFGISIDTKNPMQAYVAFTVSLQMSDMEDDLLKQDTQRYLEETGKRLTSRQTKLASKKAMEWKEENC